jgi:hypothetical protein
MRLGEIKNILSKVLNDNNVIFVENKAVYWNQAYVIDKYSFLIEALDILSDQLWNESDYSTIEILKEKYWTEDYSVQIEAWEFNWLNSYISNINTQIPLYLSILETMVDKQDEQIINIKLSDTDINSLDELNKLNKRLSSIFKQYNIDWWFEFKWFDKWTSWYEILITWKETYAAFIACLTLAWLYLKTKEQYYKSETAKFDYMASLKKSEDYKEKDLDEYTNKRLDLKISEWVKDELKKLGIKNWKSEIELQNQIIKATTELVKELWDHNTEFHLSLNPPEYAEEISWSLRIDYKKFAKIREQNIETKQLWTSEENKDDEIIEEQ